MNIQNATSRKMISLGKDLRTRQEVIDYLIDQIDRAGKLSDKEAYKQAVMERESISETGMDLGIAIPHGKSPAVREAAFAAVTLKNPITDWPSIEEDNAVTMFRCAGLLGKEEMVRRPGRPSGIRMETPDSQLQGLQTFTIYLTADKENLAMTARETLTPVRTYNKMPYNAMKLNPSGICVPYSFSLMKEDSGLILSALKKAERGEGLIARFYNPLEEPILPALAGSFARVRETNLNEEVLAGTQAGREVLPGQIRTLYLES